MLQAVASKTMPTERPSRSVKKASSSKPTRDSFFGATLKQVHPMYVVPIRTLLAPSFPGIRSHEELKAAGMLVEYHKGMEGSVLFCSHTWLRYKHPDNAQGVKFALLCALLRRAIDGTLDIKPSVEIARRRSASRSYLWLRLF